MSRSHVAVIGGGPAGLMASEVLARGGVRVTVYDRMPSVGRKFLMAGRGGLNLTHSEGLEHFLRRYGAGEPHLRAAIEAFSPGELRSWSENLGQPTFTGSSGRVFPKGMKASPLLRAWLRQLNGLGVTVNLRHHWRGWDKAGALVFDTPEGRVVVEADATVLALGGASWPRLGSDGRWVAQLMGAGVGVAPLQPANSGFHVAWSQHFSTRFEGQPLKRIGLSFGGSMVRGEVIVTATGLEGGGIYALSGALRETIVANGEATLHIDLRPDQTLDDLRARLAAPRGKQSLATFLRKAVRVSPAETGLLHEAALTSGQPLASLDAVALAALMKSVPVRLTGIAPIERAISSAGGITFGEIDDSFMLRKRPGVFVAGEMLDWEAPTGGYLLQACFATGVAAGRGVLGWLEHGAAG